MRRIEKGECPQVLADNLASWLQDYLNYRATGEPKVANTRHRHPDIKAAVLAECFDKCMYCESKISATQPGDVEHILPKVNYPNLYVDWDNLGLACTVCNTFKSDREGYINPYTTDISAHIQFSGPMIRYPIGDYMGKLTVDGLRLNRLGLLERRAIAIKSLIDKMELASAARTPALKEVIYQQIEDMLGGSEEYVGTLQAYHTQYLIGAFTPPQTPPPAAP